MSGPPRTTMPTRTAAKLALVAHHAQRYHLQPGDNNEGDAEMIRGLLLDPEMQQLLSMMRDLGLVPG